MIQLRKGAWTADVALQGAEMKRLRWRDIDLLWDGDPRWWGRTAPLLFPVIAATAGGVIRARGGVHPMPKHGFARDLAWELVERGEASAILRLQDSEATRAAYPFAFRLDLVYALEDGGLRMTARLHNPGADPLPASFGFHPAFRWPLDPARPREAHRVRFEHPEPDPLRCLDGDLLSETRMPSPVEDRTLKLHDGLFMRDALIWDAPRSRSLWYGVPGGLGIGLHWDLPHLGIWTKPGAPFLCLEPWQGYADPAGFTGTLETKPGLALVPPRRTRAWTCFISGRNPSE